MADVTLHPPTPYDLAYISRNMRAPDRAECIASGADPETIIFSSSAMSTHLLCASVGGEPACVFGLVPLSILSGIGCPWLLGTDLVYANGRALIRGTRAYIPEMLRAYPCVMNHVHARNEVAVRWLHHMGFTLQPAKEHGPYGELFHLFEMRA